MTKTAYGYLAPLSRFREDLRALKGHPVGVTPRRALGWVGQAGLCFLLLIYTPTIAEAYKAHWGWNVSRHMEDGFFTMSQDDEISKTGLMSRGFFGSKTTPVINAAYDYKRVGLSRFDFRNLLRSQPEAKGPRNIFLWEYYIPEDRFRTRMSVRIAPLFLSTLGLSPSSSPSEMKQLSPRGNIQSYRFARIFKQFRQSEGYSSFIVNYQRRNDFMRWRNPRTLRQVKLLLHGLPLSEGETSIDRSGEGNYSGKGYHERVSEFYLSPPIKKASFYGWFCLVIAVVFLFLGLACCHFSLYLRATNEWLRIFVVFMLGVGFIGIFITLLHRSIDMLYPSLVKNSVSLVCLDCVSSRANSTSSE